MLKINFQHPTFQLKVTIQNICADFFAQHGFNYFQYLRCYQDGSCCLLSTETGLVECFSEISYEPVIFSSYTEEHQNLHSYWFLWDEELPSFPVNLARERYQLHHGLTLVRRSKNYYDMIAVALPEEKRNITSFYLSKYKIIEQFINNFDKNYYHMLNHIAQNPLILPPSYRDINYKKICLPNGRIQVVGGGFNFYVTAKEAACLRLLLQGLSDKQIAQIIHISPRSVETYINRVKNRSGLVYRSDLQDLITICP